MDWDLVVVGGANTDIVVPARGELPSPGESRQGEKLHFFSAGKGANQAALAARLGSVVTLVACVGDDDRGEALIQALDRKGVDTRFVSKSRKAATGAVLIQLDRHGRSQRLAAPGANAYLELSPEAEQAIRRAKVLSVQLTPPEEVVERALRTARIAGVGTVLDPSPWRPFPKELLSLIDLLRANQEEASALTGVEVRDRPSAGRAAQHLLDAGVKWTAIQAGEEGNLVTAVNREGFTRWIEGERVDSAGAGDAYAAVLAVEMSRGVDPLKAAPLANAAAAFVSRHLGAQETLPDWQDLHSLAEQAWCVM